MRRPVPLGAFFIGAGVLHFARPKMYEAIVPSYLPNPRALVLASGVAEIAGGVAALSPRSRRFARWELVATLLGVFPANLHMALNAKRYKIPPALLWGRLPLQGAFIAWVLYATGEE